MSLDYDLGNIAGYSEDRFYVDDGDGGKDLRGVTKTLVFGAMIIGVGEISQNTALKFWTRMSIYESVFGSFRIDMPVTKEEVLEHIGLSTNVSTETDSQFYRKLKLRKESEWVRDKLEEVRECSSSTA